MTKRILRAVLFCASACVMAKAQDVAMNPYMQLMEKAWAHAKAHGAGQPVLSPVDATVLSGEVPVKELQAKGFKIVPWTTNDPEKMRAQIRMGVDGLISDRPDLLQQVLKEELASAKTDAERARLKRFDVTAHRGGRGLRPENTLPSFESGLDQLSTTLETDTGVTTDGVSLIWHDQFLNPESCRRADGQSYTMENRVFSKDISSTEAQKTFICDKLHFGPEQKNDLALSPVAVAFAKKEGLISPYVPTYVAQLFRFVNFYVEYYRTGAGKNTPHARERAENAARARFNIETKLMPEGMQTDEEHRNHTVGPQAFVDALCGAIVKNGMESRAEVQSFDFRTLVLVEEQYPKIPTYYLTGPAKMLSGPMVPEALRATVGK
ncbi:glycerophosphodiester phosphodiesterase family protein [Edaphobacter flagellatus]|uniref:glycerophosphodiester phosphodiesterase family protein n=1 Tax=Edaphobacter flagellatus TaxID=1933044 RepID=UPI0021B29A23|nr:glycerophosphodiester phosphodiesterase family protein [Edaphobacter flagellatus]